MPLWFTEEPGILFGHDKKEFKNLKNKWTGEKCIIIGNGPSLNKIDFDLSFDLFPNPTQSQLTIELNQSTQQRISFQIFDVVGKLVQEAQFINNNSYLKEQVDVSRLAAGSYEVMLSDGEFFGRARFVKM